MPIASVRAAAAVIAALVPVAVAPVASAVTPAATPALKFSGWQADYQGTAVADTPVTAAKLNGEYITVTNTTTTARAIGGYRISDKGAKHTYTIPAGFTLGAKQSVVIRSGQGINTATTLYWGQAVSGSKPVSRNNFVWDNSGEVATLTSTTGATLYTCTYTRTKTGYKAC